jgi:hypothetical protein
MLNICIRNFEILNKPLKIKKILYFSGRISHSDTFKELKKQSKITVSKNLKNLWRLWWCRKETPWLGL